MAKISARGAVKLCEVRCTHAQTQETVHVFVLCSDGRLLKRAVWQYGGKQEGTGYSVFAKFSAASANQTHAADILRAYLARKGYVIP